MDQAVLEMPIVVLTIIFLLGISAEWLAWRMQLPSILPLLLFGFIAGPLMGVVNTNELFGDLLKPVVAIGAAIILFEGGLSMKVNEIGEQGRKVVWKLLSIGIIFNWFVVFSSANIILGLSTPLSMLLATILIITGPTVMGPILKHVNLKQHVNSILKWEGMLNGPVGGMLAVIMLEAVVSQEAAVAVVAVGLIKFITIAAIMAVSSSTIVIYLFRNNMVPNYLHSVFTLTILIGFFTLSNLLVKDSGLLTAVFMGMIVANQKFVPVKHIIEFKENLRLLMISSLFIILAARLEWNQVTQVLNNDMFLFVAIVMFIARPLGVFISTMGSNLGWKERIFISMLNPKGIVTATIASFAAFSMTERGFEEAWQLIPITFVVITITIIIYSIVIAPMARMLDLAGTKPQGLLFVGAQDWVQKIALPLKETGLKVLFMDTNRRNIQNVNNQGMIGVNASALSDFVTDEVDTSGIGYMVAMTPNDGVNSLASLRFAEHIGEENVFQLHPAMDDGNAKTELSPQLRGHILFEQGLTYNKMSQIFSMGAETQSKTLSEDYDYQSFLKEYSDKATLLFLVCPSGSLTVVTSDMTLDPKEGDTLVFVVAKPD